MFFQSPKKLPISDRGSTEPIRKQMERIMSGLPRWKEYRIRQEIWREHLKHTRNSSNGAGLNAANLEGWNGTSVLLLEQIPGTRSDERIPNRSKRNRLPWIILSVALSVAGVAAYLWVYLSQFGIYR
jgi:hypothetical protein